MINKNQFNYTSNIETTLSINNRPHKVVLRESLRLSLNEAYESFTFEDIETGECTVVRITVNNTMEESE